MRFDSHSLTLKLEIIPQQLAGSASPTANVNVLSSVLPTGAATEVTLSAVNAQLANLQFDGSGQLEVVADLSITSVGIENASDVRINPATEETVATLATEATAATLATEVTVATLGTEVTSAGIKAQTDLLQFTGGGRLEVDAGVTTNTAIATGTKVVAVAGTAEPIVAGVTLINSVEISALLGNTDAVFIGGSTVDSTTNPGTLLFPGDATTVVIDDLNKVYVDSLVNGEGVSFNQLS